MSSLTVIQTNRTLEVDVFQYRKTQKYNEQKHAEIYIQRSDWRNISRELDKINDEFEVYRDGQRDFAGRLVNFENQDRQVLLELGSFEQDAIRAEPTGSVESFTSTDAGTIFQDAISRVNSLSVGTVNSSQSLDITYSNASPAKMIREIQKVTSAFIRYNDDKTVDYLQDIGSDKTSSVIISPDNKNVEGKLEIIEDEQEQFTHIRVLGAQQGKAQVTADAQINSYSAGEPQSWFKYKDQEISSQSRAQAIADRVITELQDDNSSLSVDVDVFNEDLNFGDRVTVRSNRDNFEEPLRLVEVTEVESGSNTIYECVFSNRLLARFNQGKQQRLTVDKVGEAFEGDVITKTIDSGRVHANGDRRVELVFTRPNDYIEILSAKLEFKVYPVRYFDGVQVQEDDPGNVDVKVRVPNSSGGWDNIIDTVFDQSVNTGAVNTVDILDNVTFPGPSRYFPTIEVTSGSADIRAQLHVDMYRQIGTQSPY